MCKHLGKVYDKKNGDATRGVVFQDPLDGSEIRWHHARRGRKRLSFGHYRVETRPFGRTSFRGGKDIFTPSPPGTIDRVKLGRSIPPSLVHVLDAFFSGLVIQELNDHGFVDVVAMHDSWFVPETSREGKLGGPALETAIWAVARAWLEGLRSVYDQLAYYLGNDPTFGGFVREITSRWAKRVQEGLWPNFTTG
jgi:hypothetical protein